MANFGSTVTAKSGSFSAGFKASLGKSCCCIVDCHCGFHKLHFKGMLGPEFQKRMSFELVLEELTSTVKLQTFSKFKYLCFVLLIVMW
ncbi:hypothetical protein SAY87_023821 [Trapa incisa]|uniref:Uncharacterized protein n=1 Tax=Trapa incisa TaxID=236973 RepID=A0AAN7KZH9_9MYRT|nr:hypothetical protein SAY87_023821 [Trapa incisa]